jgi:hypothetical protein
LERVTVIEPARSAREASSDPHILTCRSMLMGQCRLRGLLVTESWRATQIALTDALDSGVDIAKLQRALDDIFDETIVHRLHA